MGEHRPGRRWAHRFGGVLTEHALAPDQYTPANGWTALYWALASVGRAPTLPAASDITNG